MKRLMQGTAAAPGFAVGQVYIHDDGSLTDRCGPGMILVIRFPDVITVLDAIQRGVVGIVTELGSRTSHGCVLARTVGLPCVASIESATTSLRDGELVELDGDRGIVSLVENEEDVA